MLLYSTNIEPIHPQHIEQYVEEIKIICDSESNVHPYYGLIKNVHEGVKQLIQTGEVDENTEVIKEFNNVMEVVKAKKKKELFYSAFENRRRKDSFKSVPWVSNHPKTFASRIY